MPQSNERRYQQRAPIELRVEYQRLNRFFYDFTKNISKGGTFIKTQKPLEVGTQFLFKLIVPKVTLPVVLLGEVRWIVHEGEVHPDGTKDPGMGIQFLYESDDQRTQVEHQVESLMLDSLGPTIYENLRKLRSE
jgi:type IV pilus assembly protein PilZ